MVETGATRGTNREPVEALTSNDPGHPPKVKKRRVKTSRPVRGVRVHGQGWEVTDGTGPLRVTAWFSDVDDANAYKLLCLNARRANRERPTREDFLLTTATTQLRQRSGVTLLEVVELAVASKIRAYPRSKERYESYGRSLVNVLVQNGVDVNRSKRQHPGDLGDQTLDALRRASYCRADSQTMLRLLDDGFARMVRAGRTDRNPFERIKAEGVFGTRRSRWGRPAPSLDEHQAVALMFLIPITYRLPYLTLLLTGMRHAELHGLRLEDVNTELGIVTIRGQRGGSSSTATTSTKTPAGRRTIPLVPWLVDEFDRYIAKHHGERPGEPAEQEAWLRRFLFMGTQNGPMDPNTLTDQIGAARRIVKLGPEDLHADVKPCHDLRSTFVTWCKRHHELGGAVLSRYVGHETDSGRSETDYRPAARITGRYDRPVAASLHAFRDDLQRLVVGPLESLLAGRNPLGDTEPEDPLTLSSTATLLDTSIEHVLELVIDGELTAFRAPPGGGDAPVFDRAEVAAAVRADVARSIGSLPSTVVCRRLSISVERLEELVAQGRLRFEACSGTARTSRVGVKGKVAGGGRRIERQLVESLEYEWRERLLRVRVWPTVGEAAAVLSCSTATVRRLVDSGDLPAWRDPENGRNERRIDPVAMEGLRRAVESIPTEQAAEVLRVDRKILEYHLRRLRKGRSGSIRTITLDELNQLQSATQGFGGDRQQTGVDEVSRADVDPSE